MLRALQERVMSILVIGPAEEKLIADAVEAARKTTIPLSVLKAMGSDDPATVLLLGDRKVGVEEMRQRYKSQQVMLGTYRVALSFEEQPAGLVRHLSVSTRKGKIPGLEVMAMVLPAFGFTGIPLQRPGRVWNEEFEPGWFAVNVVELVDGDGIT